MQNNEFNIPNLEIPQKKILHQPMLEELQNVLTDALTASFEDVVVNVIICPDLMSAPFYLTESGLDGKTAIIECDNILSAPFTQRPTQAIWDMQHFLKNFAYKSFFIGGGFCAKPYLLFNGYLVMNATFSPPAEIYNASRLFYAKGMNVSGRMELILAPSRMIYSTTGNFFMSEGRQGLVLEVRAKKRKVRFNIARIIQDALSNYYGSRNQIVGLGGILMINKGAISISVIPNNIPENRIFTSNHLTKYVQRRDRNCTSTVVTLGTILSRKQNCGEPRPCHHFYTYSGENLGGRFINDFTPNETEYVGFFNVASDLYSLIKVPVINLANH